MKSTRYFICCDNADEKQRLCDEMTAKGYRLSGVSGSWPWKGDGKYHYQPIIIDIEEKTVEYMSIIGAAAMCSRGIRSYTPDEFLLLMERAFTEKLPHVLFHIPHDGHLFPQELMKSVCVPEDIFLKYHEIMKDRAVGGFVPGGYRHLPYFLQFPVSRLLCDVERFTGPEELMEKYGMGFCYRNAYDGTVIKKNFDGLRELTMKYYREHHQELDNIAREYDQMLLLDLHSYSDVIVPKDFITSEPLPDICIGTDLLYTPKQLTEKAKQLFLNAGFTVAENYPYKGCMVPNAVLSGAAECCFAGIMVEVNKQVYLDQDGEVKEAEAAKIRMILKDLVWEYEQTVSG